MEIGWEKSSPVSRNFEFSHSLDPERTYEHPESGPSNGLRRERRYSLSELIATSDRKTAAALGRTI
jgi:hypothetical protein